MRGHLSKNGRALQEKRTKSRNSRTIENIEFEKESFDSVWVHASLLHIPKSKIRSVLKRIADILKEEGLFLVSLKEGSYEGMQEDERYPGHKRYNLYYRKEEFANLLKEHFEIIYTSKIPFEDGRVFLNYICVKK